MAKNSVRDYSATNSSNTDIQSINISEGCSPAGINNAIREVMVDLKNVSTGAVALETPSADQLNVDNLRLDGNTISSTDTNGNVTIDPDGTGKVAFVSDITMTSDDPTITMTDSSGTNDIATLQATSGAFIVTARDGSADGEIIFKKTDGSATDETMRIDSSGNLGIGTSSPDSLVHLSGANPKLHIRNSSDSNRGGYLQDNGTTFALGTNSGVRNLVFSPDNTERMRIDTSGSLLIGRTNTDSNTGGHFITDDYAFFEKDGAPLFVNRFGSNGTAVQFRRQNSNVGDIYVTTSGTAYNTSSDYRLKTAVTYDWDATTRLKQLKPARFKWIVDGDDAEFVDGFIAHECSAVPEAITGTKDEVDDDGNPVMQGIDQAKIVPLLTKALIESVEKIEQLEARITALEAE